MDDYTREMKMTFVNVGYGEAILLECPDDSRPDGVFHALIDGGGANPDEFADRSSGRIPIADFLTARGLHRLDLAVSTHTHEDHICGLLHAAQLYPPAMLWQTLPPAFYLGLHPLDVRQARTPSERLFLQALNDYISLCFITERNGGRIEMLHAGAARTLCPGLTARVLAPDEADAEALMQFTRGLYAEHDSEAFLRRLDELDARMNNYSLMLLLDFCGTRILLPGDTNRAGYDGIPAEALAAHLFKVGHHGQIDGADQALIDCIRPKGVVCCASSDRRYNSANPDTMRLLRENGASLYFSDCPAVDGENIPPHAALEFTIGMNGAWRARYLPA